MTRPRRRHAWGREVHQLWFGAEWAHAEVDLEALGDTARKLAIHAPRSLRRKLAAFAATCREDPDRAFAVWVELKEEFVTGKARR